MNHIVEIEKRYQWRIFCRKIGMMTRRDVLDQLKRVGIHELSLLKRECREFENYMAVYYDYKILKKENEANPPLSPQNPTPPQLKTSFNPEHYRRNDSGLSFSPLKFKLEQNKGQ